MDDGFRARLLDAMRYEDKQLRAAIDKTQLDAWYRTTKECAEKTVAVSYDRLTAAKNAASAQAQAVQARVNGGAAARGRLVIGERGEGRTMPGGLFAV